MRQEAGQLHLPACFCYNGLCRPYLAMPCLPAFALTPCLLALVLHLPHFTITMCPRIIAQVAGEIKAHEPCSFLGVLNESVLWRLVWLSTTELSTRLYIKTIDIGCRLLLMSCPLSPH